MATQQYVCANWRPDSTMCKEFGHSSCKGCLLVVYCSKDCQKSHWSIHQTDCRSYLGKKTWQPAWYLEKRNPNFVGQGAGQSTFGGEKYFWGNVPALDILQLKKNEGESYSKMVRLLFAASGDLRNVVKTIAQLPSSYKKPIEVTINDRDLDIVARNVMILLISLAVDDTDEAIDCIIHVWYSALLRKSDLVILQQQIRPLIANFCEKIKHKPFNSLQAKTWRFGKHTLRLELTQSLWANLLSYLDVPNRLTATGADRIRAGVTMAKSRKDYLDRHLLMQTPAHRIAKTRFREDGLLLPFGYPRDDFQEPNPTFFQNVNNWPMPDSADPLCSWLPNDVEGTSSGPAKADIYGKLFYYLRAVLQAFLKRLSNSQVFFRLLHLDAVDLPHHLIGSPLFDRIEVSNISDTCYLGIRRTVVTMTPLLHTTNTHATLITLFMNAVEYTTTPEDRAANMAINIHRLRRYLSIDKMPDHVFAPDFMKLLFAMGNSGTHDHIFDRFSRMSLFALVEVAMGVEMKKENTIIEKWPYRLDLAQPVAQEQFDSHVAGGLSGKERYVEWKRTHIMGGETEGEMEHW